MGLSYRGSRVLDRLHNAIQTRGQHGLDEFRARLHEQCVNGKREATERDFIAAAGGADGVLSGEEAAILFRELGGKDSSIPFAEILRALRSPTSCQRAALTRAVFDMIDQDRDGLLSRDEITACYRANNHPDVRRGEKASAEVKQDFLQTLSDVTSTDSHTSRGATVSFPAFLDFYCSLTAFTSDVDFRTAIVAVWVPPVVLDDAHILHTLGAAGGLVANLRSQIISKGLPGVAAFYRGVRKAASEDEGGVREITQEAFRAAASFAGAQLTVSEMTQAFRHLDRRGVGKIHFADALRAVRGEVNTRRAHVIDDVFDSLLFGRESDGGGQHGETLEPATVAKLFRPEAHLDVASGARTQGEVLSEFLENFEGGGEIDGRVTRAEWREHHFQVSALIAEDDIFCEHMKRVWGVGKGEESGTEPSGDDNSGLNRSTSNSNRSAPARGPDGSKGHVEGVNGDTGVGNGGGRLSPQEGTAAAASYCAAREALDPPPPPVSNAERDPILRQVNARDATAARPSPGLLGLLRRARSILATGGMRAAFQLLKGFREEDRKGDGKVTLSGFKKAVGGGALGLGLKEAEMRIIFQHFDQGGEGEVPYELFLRHIRDTLPEGRLALAHQVFDRMDTDGDGLVFVDDVARTFRASAHPEVVEGSREEEEVRREFLESFSVTDGSHKWCTRDDVIWWMELLSSSLATTTPAADDLHFESVVRACWGLPAEVGGVPAGDGNGALGEAAQSISVVVTHADGSMSVEMVSRQEVEVHPDGRGDLLVSEEQAENIRRQLLVRGVHAVHVHLLSDQKGALHADPGADGSSIEAAAGNKVGSILEEVSSCSRPQRTRQPSADEVRTARFGPSGDGKGSCGAGCFREGEASFGFDHGLLSMLQMARRSLALRGPVGLFSLSRRLRSAGYFRSKAPPSSHPAVAAAAAAASAAAASAAAASSGIVATDGHNGPFLSLGGFKEALSEVGCGLTGKDLTNVFMHLDDGGRGEISVDVALEAIRGRLTGARLSLVRAAFTRLRGSGDAPPDSAAAVNVACQFDPTAHPDVIAGRRSPEDVRKEFMDNLTTTKGFVTRKDFESYYTDVSAAIQSDAYFCLQIKACWGLGPSAVAAVATNAVGFSGAAAPAGNSTVRLGGDYDPANTRRTYSKARTSAAPGVLPGTAERGNKVAAVAARYRDGSGTRTPTAGVAAILRKLGAEVKGHGAAWGLAGLRRALFDADRNKNGLLSFGDLKAALSSSRTGLTAPEVRALFAHLETEVGPRRAGGGGGDASGVFPWQALLDATRPRLSGERLGLVRLAFGKMDKEGKGYVSPQTVSQRFVASRHPAVLRGHASVEEVRQELLDTFFSTGASEDRPREEQQVTEEDFIEHHANLSFGVQNDADFRELVINCWGLDGGGVGGGDECLPVDVACVLRRANAPRRKFLVSYADGSQYVEELPFLSQDYEQGEAEASLTTAEERVLKRELLKRDNIHATQVTLLPHMYAEEEAPHRNLEGSLASAQEIPRAVDRRPAWTWAPMNLSEVQDAAAAAAAAAAATAPETTRHEETGMDDRQGNPVPPDDADQEVEEWPAARRGDEFDTIERAEVDWEGEEGDGGGAGGRARQRMKAGGRRMQAGQGREADFSMRYLISKLRSELNTHGVSGMVNLSRRLREAAIMLGSKGKGNCLGIGEVDFRRALREADLPLTESDRRRIFAHFEMGQSGVLNLEALMGRLHGRMGEARAVLVDEAFDRLDTSGQGHLALDKVIDAFDATKHPAVISGRQTPDSVFRDFVDGFVVGLLPQQRDAAKVTKEDFRRYYDVISATIPDDGFFELLLRSCWQIPGPSGESNCYANDGEGLGRADRPKQIPSGKHCGPSCRHFHPGKEIIKADPRIGNDHYSALSVALPPNEGREGSFDSLRESRAAGSGLGGRSGVGPSDENRLLRSARLSRIFDSQIFFGNSGDGEEESLGRYQRQGATAGDAGMPPPAPAGGGRVGRVVEGAAWTPGGRRLIPGSTAFISHLGSGMMATSDAKVENDYGASSTSTSLLLSAKGSRAVAAAATKERRVPAGGACRNHLAAQQSGIAGNGSRGTFIGADGRTPSDSISLARLMSSTKRSDAWHGKNEHQMGSGVSSDTRRTGASPRTAVERNRSPASSDDNDVERIMERPPACMMNGRGGGAFDWWGGGSALDAGNESARDGATGKIGGGRTIKVRPQTVSDTYKSSLIFG